MQSGGIARKMKELYFLLLYAQFQSLLGQTSSFLPPEAVNATSKANETELVLTEDELHMSHDESEIHRCHSQVSNTFFNQGLRLAVASMKSRLPDGIPEFGIPPMEPLELEPMEIEVARVPVPLNVTVEDMKVWDLTTFTRNNWFLDVNTRILDMNLVLPSFLVTGRFTLLPTGVKGNISIKFDGVTIKAKTRMKILDTTSDPRQTPIKAEKSVSEMKFERVRIRMTDLFPNEPGYEELNHAFRVFTEKYSEMLYEEVRPFVNAGTEKIILGITDAVLNSPVFQRTLPANGILPGLNLSTLTEWYDRVRNALNVQLPSAVTRSHPYRSLISLLEAAFKSCRSYTDVTDHLTQPFINLLGLLAH